MEQRKSSFDIQNIQLDTWEHNHRNYTPKYAIDTSDKNENYKLLKDNFYKLENNKYGTYEKLDFEKIKNYLNEKHKQSTGQKLQPHVNIFKEAVFNTDKHITKKHFDNLSKVLKEEFKISIIDISHHKDEGYIDDNGEKKINYHTHAILIMADLATGKKTNLSKQDLRNLQTRVAEVLEMPRGQDKRISKNIRLEHKQYKKYINEVNELKKEISLLSKSLDNKDKELEELQTKLSEVEKTKKQVQQENKELATFKSRFENASDTIKELEHKNNELEDLFNALGLNEIKKQTQDIKKIKQMLLESLAREYNEKRTELKSSGMAKQSDYQEIKKSNDNKKELINEAFKKQLTKNVDNSNIKNKNSKDIDIGY